MLDLLDELQDDAVIERIMNQDQEAAEIKEENGDDEADEEEDEISYNALSGTDLLLKQF